MSLRLKLALAIATIAGLVAGITGVVVYGREKADRFDRARGVVAQFVRRDEKILDSPNPSAIPLQGAPAIIEGTESGVQRSAEIPAALRRRLVDSHVYSIITTAHGLPVVIAGVRLENGSGRVYEIQSFIADTQALKDLRVALIQVGVVAAGLGALLGLLVSILLGRPLRRTAALARRIAAGDLQARLKPRGRDEIAQVGRALDEMAEALGAKIEELDEAAEREKRFSGDVAHELRTPVTGLVAAAALLDSSRPAEMVRERASALAALVEDLLEVMRLEAAGETPRVDPFDLIRLVGDVAAVRLPAAEIHGPTSLPVRSDPRRVERVVVNLLDNARRHGRAPVVVTVTATGAEAVVEVRDAGDGFGAFLRHAGERFALAAPERGKGTGLGLAIARGQARILGGTLELRDDDGAVVTLRLPGVVAGRARPAPVEVPG